MGITLCGIVVGARTHRPHHRKETGGRKRTAKDRNPTDAKTNIEEMTVSRAVVQRVLGI